MESQEQEKTRGKNNRLFFWEGKTKKLFALCFCIFFFVQELETIGKSNE